MPFAHFENHVFSLSVNGKDCESKVCCYCHVMNVLGSLVSPTHKHTHFDYLNIKISIDKTETNLLDYMINVN